MAIIKWSPFREFTDLRREMDYLFDEFFGRKTSPSKPGKVFPAAEVYFPLVDIYKRADEVVIKAAIPGVKKEDIEITFLENTLTLRGERKRDYTVRDEDYYYLEQHFGSFSRSISLPAGLSAEGMKASYKDGILEIIIPKAKKEKPRKIEVQAS
jgi:HSP20 family protein